MKKYLVIMVAGLACCVVSCNSNSSSEGSEPANDRDTTTPALSQTTDKVGLLDQIEKLENTAMSATGNLDPKTGTELLVAYQDYCNHFPKDSIAASFIYKAADVARGLGKYLKTIELLKNLHDGYPEFGKRDEVAFLVAFTYDANMKDTTKAIESYRSVIELYPKSIWATEARNNIKLLEMSEAELIRFLQDKNKGT